MVVPVQQIDRTTTQRTIIMLGMHRSGTSTLAGSLEAGGVDLGVTNASSFDNVKGNRESRRIMIMHNDLLVRNGGSWHQPIQPLKWEPIHYAIRDLVIESYAESAIWGFKDPRTLFTLNGWLDVLPAAELVGIFRHPFFVAESLKRRNDMPYEQGLELWLNYNRVLLWYFNNLQEFPIIEFTQSNEAFKSQLNSLGEVLHLTDKCDSFFEPSLRQSKLPKPDMSTVARQALVLYEKLQLVCTLRAA